MSSCCSRLHVATVQTAWMASCNGYMSIRLFFSSEEKKKANTQSVVTKSLPFEIKPISNNKENYLPGKSVVNTGIAMFHLLNVLFAFPFLYFLCLDVLPAHVSMYTRVPYAEGGQKRASDSL